MDRFRQMDTFLRVSRSGSFTAVANQIGHSPAAIARHINSLESYLGVRLLNRSTRSITLTPAGITYSELCQRVVDDIQQCESLLSSTEKSSSGMIKMIAPKSFGSMQLGDAIVEFCNKNTDISISITLEDFSSRPLDFVERGYDLALRWGIDLKDSTLVASKLGSVVRKLVASPGYLAKYGTPSELADIARHNCLLHVNAYADKTWRFVKDEQEVGIKISGDFASDSALMLRKAALAGRGLAVLRKYCVGEDLESGALVEVLPEYTCPATPLLLLYREKRLLPSRVRLLIEFLRVWFEENAQLLR
ncbi:LysR family transcriptional regulator [Novosphingobium sp. MW5]|nr:LysR family transcriptional regulator [Novosphingobium sp. MW5]